MALWSSLVGIFALVCAIWVIYDVVMNNKRLNTTKKVIWIACAILFSIITAIVYLFVGKKK